jgi:uncharacterized protein YukE
LVVRLDTSRADPTQRANMEGTAGVWAQNWRRMVKVLGGSYIYPGYRQADAVPTAINGEPVVSSPSETDGSGEDHPSERRTGIGRHGISSSEALAMRPNAQAAPVAPTTTTRHLMRPFHRRTRTVASIPQSALPPLPPPGISTPVSLRALPTPTPHAVQAGPDPPPPSTYGATSAAVSLSARARRMVAEAMRSSTSSGESAADGSSGDSDTAAEAAADGSDARSPMEMQWVRDAHQAYHARYAELLQAEAEATREAQAAARRLRGEAQSVASMELGELEALESELWQSLQRVSRAKLDAMQACFERRLQARSRDSLRCSSHTCRTLTVPGERPGSGKRRALAVEQTRVESGQHRVRRHSLTSEDRGGMLVRTRSG